MSDFSKGDLVVCINAKPDELDPLANLLVERRTYRVGAAGIRQDGQSALAFHEIPSRPGKGWAFTVGRFRKLTKADEQFTQQMRSLKPVKVSSNV